MKRRNDITDECKESARERLSQHLDGVKVWDTPFRDAREVLHDWLQEYADEAVSLRNEAATNKLELIRLTIAAEKIRSSCPSGDVSDIDFSKLEPALGELYAAIQKDSLPAECIGCGCKDGPLLKVDADCPGWLCDSCYQTEQAKANDFHGEQMKGEYP